MSAEVEVTGVPRDVAARIRTLYEAKGELSDRAVLADARDESSPLHGYFEWDDDAAAEAYRLEQAQALIRRVKVTVIREPDAPPIRVRAWVARRELPPAAEASDPGTYLPIERIAGQTAYEVSVRESIERDLARVKKKYSDTALLFEVAGEVFGQ